VILKEIRFYNTFVSDQWLKATGHLPQNLQNPALTGYFKLDEWGGTIIYNSVKYENAWAPSPFLDNMELSAG